jgi:hypothetical protein
MSNLHRGPPITALPNESKLGRKHPWKVIYKDCLFSSHPLIKWPPQAILVSDWSISRGEKLKSANQKKNFTVAAMFVSELEGNEQSP